MTAHATRSAIRFFWGWLIGSAAVSTLGTVTHAVLGDAPSPAIASAVAFFTVAIQLCATYGVHALVHAHITGAAYRAALCIAIALAALSFVLNFVQLRDLVITWAAIAPVIAWIVPLIIDLGMTGSIIAILALTSAARTEQLQTHNAQPGAQAAAAVHVEVHSTVHAETHTAHSDAQPAQLGAHHETAQRIVAQGVTRIEIERVAQVLDDYAQTGATPSVIGRRTGVHHETVARILEAA
ncbi:hypothetical protein [Mycolicibacterium porcinum]|uniref:DUF2637 domain-containing protein n=1 Tax=Mycolicibacterium porcinum TaxID=39693 RepID=A0ABV3VMS5_9MYCO